MISSVQIPQLAEIQAAHERFRAYVHQTPVWEWKGDLKDELLDSKTEVLMKLEVFQIGNSFKPRGALSVMLDLPKEALERGVTAVSAGNHAIAVTMVARLLGTHSKVVMPPTASPASIARCEKLGAEVVVVGHVSEAFDKILEIQQDEGRTFVHPFEGPLTTLGTATLGWEYYRQAAHLDAAIIPIGGGGLASGMALAFKQLNPDIRVFGVEAFGAPNMYNSFQLGRPAQNPEVNTIAASLAPPFSMPYSYSVCRQFLEKVVLVNDDELCRAMAIAFEDLKLVLEPAGASSLAAILGPLKQELAGMRVGVIACGSNIDIATFSKYIERGNGLNV